MSNKLVEIVFTLSRYLSLYIRNNNLKPCIKQLEKYIQNAMYKVCAVIEAVLNKVLGNYYQMILAKTVLSSLVEMLITIAMSLFLILPCSIINKWFPWTVGSKNKLKWSRRIDKL